MLKTRVFLVDDIEFAFAANNLTISTTLLDRGPDFHGIVGVKKRLLIAIINTAAAQIIRTHLYSYLITR